VIEVPAGGWPITRTLSGVSPSRWSNDWDRAPKRGQNEGAVPKVRVAGDQAAAPGSVRAGARAERRGGRQKPPRNPIAVREVAVEKNGRIARGWVEACCRGLAA